MDDLNLLFEGSVRRLRVSEIPWPYAVNQVNKAVTDFQKQLEESGSEEDKQRSAELEKCWQRILHG